MALDILKPVAVSKDNKFLTGLTIPGESLDIVSATFLKNRIQRDGDGRLFVDVTDLEQLIADVGKVTLILGHGPTLPDLTVEPGLSYPENGIWILESDAAHNGGTSMYILVENNGVREWEYVGGFDIDLSDYITEDELAVELAKLPTFPLSIVNGGTGCTTETQLLSYIRGLLTNSGLVNLESGQPDDLLKAVPRPGVTGTLRVVNGGTGVSSDEDLTAKLKGMLSNSGLVNLTATTADDLLKAAPRPGVTGTLSVANGGTGCATEDALKTYINSLIVQELDFEIINAPRTIYVETTGDDSKDGKTLANAVRTPAGIARLMNRMVPGFGEAKVAVIFGTGVWDFTGQQAIHKAGLRYAILGAGPSLTELRGAGRFNRGEVEIGGVYLPDGLMSLYSNIIYITANIKLGRLVSHNIYALYGGAVHVSNNVNVELVTAGLAPRGHAIATTGGSIYFVPDSSITIEAGLGVTSAFLLARGQDSHATIHMPTSVVWNGVVVGPKFLAESDGVITRETRGEMGYIWSKAGLNAKIPGDTSGYETARITSGTAPMAPGDSLIAGNIYLQTT